MDGVHVKIAEAYKPPRKIGLPAAYNNRLPDVSKLMYDFSLEKSVLEKMCEWRKARQAYSKARQARLREKRKKEKEEAPPSPPPPLADCVKQVPVNAPPAPETILTPQPLSSPPANDLQDHVKTNGDLDFADFDNDTSSPFDNMELKTINDMEELAQVLQPRSQWMPAGKLENIISELTIDETSEICKEEETDTESPVDDEADADALSVENHRSVSTIMQELQKELERPVMENWKPWPDLESPDSDAAHATPRHDDSNHAKPPADLLSGMTEDDLKLVMQLGDMGFPKSRAARAVLELGRANEKKIVEYLLAVQSLEETGVPSDYAETALTLTQHDQSKAKIYYENLCTLKDLGFPEDKASAALVKCNFDRDKALDLLIA